MSAHMRGTVHDFGAECPKCKAMNGLQQHCPKGCKMAEGEHLDNLCLNCGYAWPARTADHQPIERKTTKRKKGEQTA